MPKLTICGGGNAAHVLMALAANAGWQVDVFTPVPGEAERLQAGLSGRNGLMAAVTRNGTITGQPRRISANPAAVIPGSAWVLLALPAFAHGPILQAIAGMLEPGCNVGALPARGGFDYQALSILEAAGKSATVFGLQTLPWACRIVTYGQSVEILGTKAVVDLAAFPPDQAPLLAEELAPLLGVELNPVSSFLTLTLANTGQLIHPGIMYGLCRGKEEATFTAENIPLFYQGVNGFTADVLQAMSNEVQTLAKTVGRSLPHFNVSEVRPLYRWLLESYPNDIVNPTSLHTAFVSNKAYRGLRIPARPAGPDTFTVDYSARYLAEDVPYGLVVLRGIAGLVGAATPAIDEVILWAQERLNRQYLVGAGLSGPDVSGTRAPQAYGIDTPAKLLALYRQQTAS